MQGVLSIESLAEEMIGQIAPRDAMQFLVSCRVAAEAAQTFKAANAFVLTRPGSYSPNDERSGLSTLSLLKVKKSLWKAMAEAHLFQQPCHASFCSQTATEEEA